MKLLTTLFLAVAILTNLLWNNSEVSAKESEIIAKCAMPTFTRAYADAKTIFVGKVLSLRTEGSEKILTFRVEKYWKGAVAKKVEVRYFETFNYEVWLKTGGRYLVYARGNEDGSLSDGRCSLTKKYTEARSDLKRLKKGKLTR